MKNQNLVPFFATTNWYLYIEPVAPTNELSDLSYRTLPHSSVALERWLQVFPAGSTSVMWVRYPVIRHKDLWFMYIYIRILSTCTCVYIYISVNEFVNSLEIIASCVAGNSFAKWPSISGNSNHLWVVVSEREFIFTRILCEDGHFTFGWVETTN